jgi:thiol-disulfide isomerase/thioredoxin
MGTVAAAPTKVAPRAPATRAAPAVRTQAFSIQNLDGGDRGEELAQRLHGIRGVRYTRFDLYTSELTVMIGDGVSDDAIVAAIASAGPGWRAIPGPGQGRYLPMLDYPAGADVSVLTRNGSRLGPLEKLRAPNRTTIFDIYADWCVACRPMDAALREFVHRHPGVSVRRLNLGRWDSPLAKDLGPALTALPHLVIYTADGRRHEFDGNNWAQVARAMKWQ